MTEQGSRPSLKDLIKNGDFGRVGFTPEFAALGPVEQLDKILEAINNKRNKLAGQVNLTERTSALINSLGIVARTISRIATISTNADMSDEDKRKKIREELENLYKGSEKKQDKDSASI